LFYIAPRLDSFVARVVDAHDICNSILSKAEQA
jgi:hypothetical protein